MYNTIVTVCHLVTDPELKETNGGKKVCKMRLCISPSNAKTKNFIDAEAWDRQAEVCSEYLKKGRQVLIQGELCMDAWEKDGKKFTSKLEGTSEATRMDQIDKRPIVMVDLTFNNKFYTDVPIGLTTKDSRSTFLINRDLLTRFKVNVNPNRKFVLSSWIERSDGNDTRGVNLPLDKDE
jgi:single-strand DNA-binding protein